MKELNSIEIKPDLTSSTQLLAFNPFPGFSSPHLQTIMACFTLAGTPPPSTSKIIPLDDGDSICCEVSTPPSWNSSDKTIVLIHGLGGSHNAGYMVRISRKLYLSGYRAIRVNMRCCGTGKDYAQRPYHGGLSSDVYHVLNVLKDENPLSPITVIGYSLGGNIALKLAAELGEIQSDLLEKTIAVCPPVDLAETSKIMAHPANNLYNRYYIHHLERLTRKWTAGKPFSTIYEFDELVTSPNWGFNSPSEYYEKSSSCYKLTKITHPCNIIFAADDPFINYQNCVNFKRSSAVKVWVSEHGGHMGFFGWADKEHGYYWLDKLLLKWVSENV